MYEISLVPDVKAELLRKLRLRNLFILICIGVGIACGVIVFVLVTFMTGQNIAINEQNKEIACRYDMRYDGKTLQSSDCKNKGTAVMNFNNLQTLLTMQDQLQSLETLNNSMIKFSRIFGLLDVLLINEENGSTISMTELSADFSSMTISFDAVGRDNSSANIGYKPLEAFKKNAERMRYDYGEYMRRDENGEYVEIPYFCISETTVNGLVYGIYHKGTPGCEAPMVTAETETGLTEDEDETNSTDTSEATEVVDIYIRRTYRNQEDYEKVRNGEDEFWNEELMGKNDYKGYYFESACTIWGDDGEIDETNTIALCPFLNDELVINNSSYARDANDEKVLTFEAVVPVSTEIFMSGNHNMQILGPTRQNVTDSYVQVRDMFVSGDTIQAEGE